MEQQDTRHQTHTNTHTTNPLPQQRRDDNPKSLTKRLAEYHSKTTPVLEHYTGQGCVVSIDANQKPGDVAFAMGTVAAAITP